MARINIEDSLFKDNRFTELCILLGSRRLALGAVVEAFVLAQEHVSVDNPTGLVPEEKWTEQRIAPEIESCRLAELRDGRFELFGAKEQFKWLIQRKLAAVKGGEATAGRQPVGPDRKPTEPGRPPNPSQTEPNDAGANPLTPSLSLAPVPDSQNPSGSGSGVASEQLGFEPEVRPLSKPRSKKRSQATDDQDPAFILRRTTWEHYCEAYIKRWSHAPSRNQTTNRLIKKLVEQVGEEAPRLVVFYVNHPKAYYVGKCHSLEACVHDYQALLTQMKRDQPITGAHIRQYEKAQSKSNMIEEAERGGF